MSLLLIPIHIIISYDQFYNDNSIKLFRFNEENPRISFQFLGLIAARNVVCIIIYILSFTLGRLIIFLYNYMIIVITIGKQNTFKLDV